VVARVLMGGTTRSVAEIFDVGVSSVVRWSQRHRSRGNTMPDKMGRGPSRILDEQRSWLLERIAHEPDVTLRQLQVELAERGVEVSYGTVQSFVHREGLSFKKKCPSQRAGSAGRRALPSTMEKVSAAY